MARALAFLAVACMACGPSFQAVYEGNARFEHCYALEESAQTPMPDKAACWRDWSEHYTYGQTRDRVHYATARYVALTEAHDAPTDEALMNAAPGMTPRQSTITAPAPTNAFAPPPKTLEPGGTTKAPEAPEPPKEAPPPKQVSLPASTCSDRCSETYRTCDVGCTGDAGAAKAKACASCQKTYRACMRDCFK